MSKNDIEKSLNHQVEKAERTGQRNQRIAKVSELLMSGLTGTQIFQIVTEKLGWPVKQRVVLNYMQEANRLFAQDAKAKSGDEFGKALRRLNMLFAASLKIQDYKACLSIQREINLMMGFTNKSFLEHSGEVKQQVNTQIQIEYIHSKKEIATSEKNIDTRRITDAQIIDIENEETGTDDDGRTAAEIAAATSSAIPSEQTVQEDQGMQGQDDNTPGWHVFE